MANKQKKYKAILGGSELTEQEKRFIIVDSETGKVLDDAQGFGYRSPIGAYASYAQKIGDKTKERERKRKQTKVGKWAEENEDFIDEMDDVYFRIAKEAGGENIKFGVSEVREMLEDCGFSDLPFTPNDLLSYWRKR